MHLGYRRYHSHACQLKDLFDSTTVGRIYDKNLLRKRKKAENCDWQKTIGFQFIHFFSQWSRTRDGGGGGYLTIFYMTQTCRWNSHLFQVIYLSIGHDFVTSIHLESSIQHPAVQSLTTWPVSLRDILLSGYKSVYNPKVDCTDDFLHQTTQFKWKQGTFLVILHDGIYIYRYTFPIFQYTFIGWVWGGLAAHL